MLKPNMNPKRNPMPTQKPEVRAHNFNEVATGYSEENALDEAFRCLNCKNMPCVSGCPVNIHIPQFIEKIREGDFEAAYQIISETSSLPAVCGRVCPQETQCEAKCVRGLKGESVGIGRLERFVADWHNAHSDEKPTMAPSNGHRVAIVGSGPSGLTCAGDLAKKGYKVTIFEALHTAGGVLVYGIPEFRLPKAIVQKEVDNLIAMGVDVETNIVIGKTLTIDELFEQGYEAVFVGSGAGLPNFMNIPGESLKGVYSANEFLTRNNLMKAYRSDPVTPIMKGGRVAVVGGGNVAMDAARTALRLGAEKVYIVYRRSLDELPARREEVEHAMAEGVDFRLLNNPVEILGYNNPDDARDPKNGFVTGMKCIRMELGEPDEKGRRRPIPVEGSEFILDVDTVVIAIGTSPNPLIKSTTKGLDVNKKGGIIVEENTGKTSREGVYAGGDAVTGSATVISAMGAGKAAAKAIDEYLSGESVS
ncbi:MAG: NADPH-dependent glutamate synthase [Christensenellaceae bacterium]|nr:NADPH-dependent glutamate synthase [Christensenellaceae bacterium]